MLPARYHGLRDRVLARVDHVFAEPVLLRVNKSGEADPSRPSIEIEAILRVGGGKETSVAGSQGATWRTRINAQRAELHVDRAKYPGIAFRIGDEVQAPSRIGEPWFEVLAVDDRSMTRLVVQLGETV